MKSLVIVLALITISISAADSPDTLWTRVFDCGEDDLLCDLIQTADGGFAMTGYTVSSGIEDVWLVKTDENGMLEWEMTYAYGKSSDDRASALIQTPEGGYAIIGTTTSYGSSDVWLLKVDAAGAIEWESTYDGSGYDAGTSIQRTTDGGYILGGISLADVWLIKINSAGDIEWDSTFDTPYWNCYEAAVIQTSDDGYAIAANSFSHYFNIAWMMKTTSIGELEWSVSYGFNGGIESICQTDTGNYMVLSTITQTMASQSWINFFCADSLGNELWSEIYAGDYNVAGDFIRTEHGYVIAGTKYDSGLGVDIILIESDSTGTHLGEWYFDIAGGSEMAYSIVSTTQGNYAVTGAVDEDAFLMLIGYPQYIAETETAAGTLEMALAPTPFSTSMAITYCLPEPGYVEINSYDLSGRMVESIEKGWKPAGITSTVWSPEESVPDGCYLIVLDACGEQSVRRCVKL